MEAVYGWVWIFSGIAHYLILHSGPLEQDNAHIAVLWCLLLNPLLPKSDL